jgi:aryl-alcohol dehydrogenase-like predicted oxidoreductase
MKFVIGSVQFGIKYGVNNFDGIPSDLEVKNILEKAISNQIDTIDTAAVYGNAESRLGQLAGGKFKFISKFPHLEKKEFLREQFSSTIKNLYTTSLYGYMAHNADFLISNPDFWPELQKLKSEGLVFKIGYSLYNPEQLDKLLDLNFVPDIVQFPYSLLDRKFESKFDLLKKLDAEIHVRSVFLQGLYFRDLANFPAKLLPLKEELQKIHQIASDYNESVSSLALNFVYQNPNINKVVIGVDKAYQIENNIVNVLNWKSSSEAIQYINKMEVLTSDLLNPSNW